MADRLATLKEEGPKKSAELVPPLPTDRWRHLGFHVTLKWLDDYAKSNPTEEFNLNPLMDPVNRAFRLLERATGIPAIIPWEVWNDEGKRTMVISFCDNDNLKFYYSMKAKKHHEGQIRKLMEILGKEERELRWWAHAY